MRTSITLILERKRPFQNTIYFQQRCCTNLFSGGYDDAYKIKRTLYALVSFGAAASFLLSRLAQTAGQSNRFFSRHSLSPIDSFFSRPGF